MFSKYEEIKKKKKTNKPLWQKLVLLFKNRKNTH